MNEDHTHDSDIAFWLSSIGMGEHAGAFVERHIGIESLPALTDAQLQEMGVVDAGHRATILAAASHPSEEAGQSHYLGGYEIREEICHTKIGALYHSRDASTGNRAVVEMLYGDLVSSDPGAREAFLKEAGRTAEIHHPNIAQVYSVGEEHGIYFIAMELLEGQTIADRLASGPLSEKQALATARQVVEALAAAHAQGFIHGDIKPSNIFLIADETVKLLNFGLAKQVSAPAVKERLWVDSANYVSPERVASAPEDFRSDIYSLGVTLFHAMSGAPPNPGEDAPRLKSVKPAVSTELDDMLARMLARDPGGRYASYEELLAALKEVEATGVSKFDPGKKMALKVPGFTPGAMSAPAVPPPGVPSIPPAAVPTGATTGPTPHAAPVAAAAAPVGAQAAPARVQEAPPPEEPTPEALEEERVRRRRRKLIASVIVASIAVHLVFGVLAGFWIVARFFEKPKAQFQVQKQVSIEPEKRQHRMQTEQMESLRPKPVYNNRIASLRPTALSLPELPKVPVEEIVAIDTEALISDTMDVPTTSRVGQGTGAGGGFFGGAGKAGTGLLEGTFYDLKQTNNGRPSGVNANNYGKVIKSFGRSFQESVLKRYFQAPTKLYATRILMPFMVAAEAPKAFGVADKVQPSQWVVLYKGRVKAPESGRFRFVGTCDDILLVRFDNRFVLEGSWESARFTTSKYYKYDSFDDKRLQGIYERFSTGGDAIGSIFEVTKDSEYDIEILIGEGPGGNFYAELMIEKIGENYPKDPHGNPILPFFQLVPQDVPPNIENVLPPHAPNPSIWPPAPTRPSFSFPTR